jgi:hypothetical protein
MKMIDTLKFDLASLERAFENIPYLVSDGVDSLTFEVTISPQFLAALLANKDRFIGCIIGPGDSLAARAFSAD